MAERRQALLIACEEFVDPQYKRLITPVRDARALAKILGDPEIGQFSVELLENASRDAVVDKLEGFFEEARPDDVLLLYLAGHGDLDEQHKFYFVAHDTRSKRLLGKGVADHLIHAAMARSLSKRQILILDCCYSGAIRKAWASEWISRGDASVGIKQKLTGEGRVVLTASDILEYAYEKRSASGEVESLFTNRIIEGIERGDADMDGDGYISVDELYSYVEERIRCEDPSQNPLKLGRVRGQLWLAKTVPRPDALPRAVIDLLNHSFPSVRLAGVEELQQRLSSNPALYPAAVQALTKLRSDADSTVQLVASRFLDRIEALKREEQERVDAEKREREKERPQHVPQSQLPSSVAPSTLPAQPEADKLSAETPKVVYPLPPKPVEPEREKPPPSSSGGTGGKTPSKQVIAFLAAAAVLVIVGLSYIATRQSPPPTGAQVGPSAAQWFADAVRNLKLGNFAEALPLLQRSANAGDKDAMNNLGELYYHGQGVAQDYGKAREWYQKAANAGNPDAMNNLGELYYHGQGVAQDYGKARQWYQKAADADNTDAMFNLGWLYEKGQGVAQDYGKARQWYQKAADADNIRAKGALSRLGNLSG